MATEELRWEQRPSGLRSPVLIAAFEGWNDAGEAASAAVEHLAEEWLATPAASIDPEEYFDFSSTRPTVELVDGVTRRIVWPRNEFSVAAIEGTRRDTVLLRGTEPQLRWKTFCAHIIEVAQATGVEMVVTLGALLADVAHTRPVRITGTASDARLIERFGLQRSRYEGPTGIVGVLHDRLATAGIASCSLWAAVPHYLQQTPCPKAALALVERISELLGADVTTTSLEIATAHYERQVNEVVESDDDMVAYLRRLEAAHDDGTFDNIDTDDDDDDDEEPLVADRRNLPSGDDLAAELEQFLRDNDT
jgi:proteasome assembly chaperone (PAC2) family protein